MSENDSAREGVASSSGFRTRFRVVGKHCSHGPLLCIHGGPGYGSDYLRPLEEMRATGRQVVFYDQLGCGDSELPDGSVTWSLQLFLEEIDAVRAAAGLERCHILGHGWGGMLALQYALGKPAGLDSLVLSSAVASVPQWRHELSRLIQALPEEIRVPLQQELAAAAVPTDATRGLAEAFLRRHLCRLNPWPECLERSRRNVRKQPAARRTLFGRNEMVPAGLLVDWDVTQRLGEITCPTLVVSGRYDMATPPTAAILYQGIPSSEWVVFEYSAHVPHLEEPQRYLEVLDGFLGKVEGARSPPG